MSPPLLSITGLTKAFPGLLALDDVTLEVGSGEIVAVVGQNGSGKSTLVKLLAGVYTADAGDVRISHDVEDGGAGSPPPRGMHFIHQDLGLIPLLTTVENLDLRSALGRRGLLPFRKRREIGLARELIARFGASFDVQVPVSELSAAERTIVAIARALAGWARPDEILVLDEPTAALHGNEVGRLFTAVKRVAQEGAGVIFISHRLDEVLGLADRVVALRDGRLVADVSVTDLDHDQLVRIIAGRDLKSGARQPTSSSADVVLTARRLCGGTVRRAELSLRGGEILGISGSLGSGRENLGRLLFGALPPTSGEIHVMGERLNRRDPREAIRRRVGFVSGDRHLDGAVMSMSVRENLTLPMLAPLVGRFGQLRKRAERDEAQSWSRQVELRPPDPERTLSLFSGGNQQKVVLATWLRTKPRVLLLDEPTQGVDVGAKDSIYTLIASAAQQGCGVLVTSSDTKELASLCDRVLVMRDGYIVGELQGEGLTEAEMVRHSLGLSDAVAEVAWGGKGRNHG